MMQQLRANTERVNATASRVADLASATLGSVSKDTVFNDTAATSNGITFAWNAMPVHTTAICTHGKRYERRLQEMLT